MGTVRAFLSGFFIFATFLLTIGSILELRSVSMDRLELLIASASFLGFVGFSVARYGDEDPFGFGILCGTLLGIGSAFVRLLWPVGDCPHGCLSLESMIPVTTIYLIVGVVLSLPELLNIRWEA